jgi:hypothetical protein
MDIELEHSALKPQASTFTFTITAPYGDQTLEKIT